jgi:dTMP kinase
VGLFIAIEGGDGSGKQTQTDLLVKRLEDAGVDVMKVSFPRYGEPSAEIVGKYLNGDYGTVNEVHPDLASLPYAIDRYAAKQSIVNHLAKAKSVVIADRYVASNLAHQGTKLADAAERQAFYDRITSLEYDVLQLPQPTINLVLLVPSNVAQANVDKKDARIYTEKKRDIHEADESHLDKARQNYIELTELNPEHFTAINCMKSGSEMRTIEDIHEDIWDSITGLEAYRETVS